MPANGPTYGYRGAPIQLLSMPKTAAPFRNTATSLPTAAISPDSSLARIGCLGSRASATPTSGTARNEHEAARVSAVGNALSRSTNGHMLKFGVLLLPIYIFEIIDVVQRRPADGWLLLGVSFGAFLIAITVWILDKKKLFRPNGWGHGIWHLFTCPKKTEQSRY